MAPEADGSADWAQGDSDGRGQLEVSRATGTCADVFPKDAKRAYDMGCDAIYLSNHGGRALDGYVYR